MGQPYPEVAVDTWLPYGQHAQVCYLAPGQQRRSVIFDRIREIRPDIIYLNSMFSTVFTLHPLWGLWRKSFNSKVVLAPRGMLQAGAMQYKTLKKRSFLQLLRATDLPQRLRFHATDQQEQADIIRYLGVGVDRIQVIPNLPQPPVCQVRQMEKRSGVAKMLFLSRVVPKKNILGLLQLLVKMPPCGQLQLTIAGPVEDAAYWADCEAVIAQMPAHIEVDYRGAVPHPATRAQLEDHHFFVLPTFGENFGHSIFEALACGRPVIISDQTPWRDLHDKGIGWDLPLDDAPGWQQVLREMLAMDQDAYDTLCQRAYAFAQAFLRERKLKDRYLELFLGD